MGNSFGIHFLFDILLDQLLLAISDRFPVGWNWLSNYCSDPTMEGLVVQWKDWLHQLINHSYLVAPDLLKCYLAFSFANLFSRLWNHVLACSICEFVFAFLDHVLALQHQRSSDCAIILVSLRPQDPWCCAWKEWFVKERDLDLGLSGGWVVRQNGLICSICGGLGPPFLDLIFPKLALLFFGVTILEG